MGKKKTLNKDRRTQDVSKQEASTLPPSYPILVAIIIVITGAILIFSNLSNRYLWEDEAETALLARNILTYGIPKAFDGKNLISQELGRDYDKNYIWRWTPWLDKYITAASFKVFGEGTLSARAPFALFGVLSLISIYFVSKRIFKDPWLGVLSMTFLAFSIPFLLYVRQCRYYSIGFFASILNEALNRNVAIYFPFVNYLYEITHDFDGPIKGIVKFLLENAHPKDRVFITYGDLPLKFYTGLEVKGGATGEDLTGWSPDWIIVRSFFRFGDRENHRKDAMKMGEFLEEFTSQRTFRTVEIPYRDIWWENIPEPWFHSFRTPMTGPYVKINRTLGLK